MKYLILIVYSPPDTFAATSYNKMLSHAFRMQILSRPLVVGQENYSFPRERDIPIITS